MDLIDPTCHLYRTHLQFMDYRKANVFTHAANDVFKKEIEKRIVKPNAKAKQIEQSKKEEYVKSCFTSISS